ncbi:phage tail tape measure protein [Cellulosilyticum sp. I15G10I2]|uniref:phage tail tape measure protein n=1 Tax=Cellulosilyticum sp. I15G10I2 TaxID=1892843 RepID=UPI000A8D1109|nr:phage tail tape measure protein [Cellulosilyticum sp. I15G10I2]
MDAIFKLSVFVNMVDNITQPMGSVGRSLDGVQGKLVSLDNGFKNMAKSGMMMTGIGVGMTQAALAPVGATFETKKALGELASVGVKNLGVLEDAAKDFSDTWAGTTKAEFITAAYDIKSGISTLTDEAVAEYTKIAGMTAKGTKASTAEMTSLFATGYGIYKGFYKDMSDLEFGEMFSAGIAKSVQQFKTDGSKMSQAIQTLGASATTSNVPLEEQLSILGMLQATMGGGEAGTKYKAFLKSAAKAGEELGLSFLDANNQLLSMPEILTTIRGKFGETMDAAEKMELQKAFGTEEAVALIDLLYNKTDELEGNILGLYDTMGQGTSVAQGMADAINSADGEKFTVLKQKIQNTVETIGNGMLPTINQWMEKGDQLLGQVSSWIGNNQQLASNLFLVIAVIGVVLAVMGVFATTIGFIGTTVVGSITNFRNLVSVLKKMPDAWDTIRLKAMYAGDAIKLGFTKIRGAATTVITGMKNVTRQIITMGKAAVINGFNALKSMTLGLIGMAKQAITTAVTAMPGLIASTWAWTAALLANPVTWIVVGIVALIAAIILLWRNWDTVVAWLKGAWQAAIQGVINGFNWVKEKVTSMPNSILLLIAAFIPFIGIPMLIMKNWESIKSFFTNLWTGIKDGFNNFITGWIPNMQESGKKVISTFVDGIRSMINKPAEIVKEGLSKVRQLLPFSDAKEGPLSSLTLSGSKVFTTIGEGMEKTMTVPSLIADDAFQDVDSKLDMDSIKGDRPKNLNLKETFKQTQTTEESTTRSNSGTSIKVGNITLQFDMKDLEDIKFIKKLIEELKNLGNQDDPDDEDLVTA